MSTQVITASGAVMTVKVGPAQGTIAEEATRLRFAFNIQTEAAAFEREGDNLVITLQDGRKVVLEEFFVVAKEGDDLPVLVLEDGTEVAAADFLLSMNPDMDVTASGQMSGGGEAYADDAGELVDGMENLGKTGTDQWSSGTSLPDPVLSPEDFTLSTADAWSSVDSGSSSPLLPPLPPQPPSPPPVEPPPPPPAVEPPPPPPPPVEPPPPPPVEPPPPPPTEPPTPPPPPEILPDPLVLSRVGRVDVYEAALTDGSDPGSGKDEARGSFFVKNPQGGLSLSIDSTPVNLDDLAAGMEQKFSNSTGELVLRGWYPDTGEVQYAYTLSGPQTHDDPLLHTSGDDILFGGAFTVSVTDERGIVVADTLSVFVVDDAPAAHPDYVEITADTLAELAVPSESRSLFTGERSADGITLTKLSYDPDDGLISDIAAHPDGSFTVAAQYGTFHIAADGKYTFDPGQDFETLSGAAEITFTYTLRDGDGDLSSAQVTLDMYRQAPGDPNLPPEINCAVFAPHDTVTATGNVDGSYGMYSKTAALGDGGYVVTYKNGPALYFRTYNADGESRGDPVLVANNAYVSTGGSSLHFDYSDSFSVSSTPDGGFLVTWDTTNRGYQTDGIGGYGSVYSADGNPVGGLQNFIMAASDYGGGNQQRYTWRAGDEYTTARDGIALSNGGFVAVTHDNDGAYFNAAASFYNRNGTLANSTLNNGSNPDSIINLDDYRGHTFDGRLTEISPDKIVAVYMHSAGSRDTGTSSKIEGDAYVDHYGTGTNTITLNILTISRNAAGEISNVDDSGRIVIAGSGHNKMPEVSALGDGRFVVAWQLESGQDSDVQYQIFDQSGNAVTSVAAVEGAGDGAQYTPAVQALSGGGFVLAWAEMVVHADGERSYDIMVRRYANDGTPQDNGPLQVAQGVEGYGNDGTYGTQRHPDITELADGRLVISWTTMSGGREGTAEVHHQIFAPDALAGGNRVVAYALPEDGEESILPLALALHSISDPNAELSSGPDSLPDSVRVSLSEPRTGDFLAPDAAWCAANGVRVTTSASKDTLTFTLQPDSSLDAAAQWALLTEAAKRVSFDNSLPAAQVSGGERTVHIRAADAQGSFSSTDVSFDVVTRNDAPVVLSAGADHASLQIGDTVSFAAAGIDFRISDAEMDDITSARIRINNYEHGRDFLDAAFPADDPRFVGLAVSFDAGRGELVVTGAASTFVYQEALSLITYTCLSNVPVAEDRAFSVTVSDANGLTTDSAPAHFSLTAVHPHAPLLVHSADAGGDMSFGSGTDPVTVALSDGGFAVIADAGGNLVLKCFDAGGQARPGATSVIEGLDGIREAVPLAGGGIILLGELNGVRTAALLTAEGNIQPLSFALDAITNVTALPGGGLLLTGVVDGGMVCRSVAPGGALSGFEVTAAHDVAFGMEAAVLNTGATGLLYRGDAGIIAEFFDAQGSSLGAHVLNGAVADPSASAIRALDNGNFVVAWSSNDVPSDVHTASEIVRCRVFDASGNPLGQDFYLDTVAYRTHDDIDIADLGGGRFVVGWSVSGYGHNGAESTVWDTQGFSYGSMGLSQADAGSGTDGGTRVTALADGGYVMAWQSGSDVEYRVFNADGTPRAANFSTVNQGPVAVFGDIGINDPDLGMIAQAVVTISPASSAGSDVLSLDAGFIPADNGLTVTFGSGVLTISGEAPAEVYEAALQALRFASTNNAYAGERSLGVVLTDTDNFSSNTLTVPIEVHAAPNPVYGSEGTIAADYIQRWSYSDDIAVDLGFGNDTLRFEAQHAHVSGGQGNDSIYGYTYAQADINGGDGNDTITLYNNSGSAAVDGGSGNDTVTVYSYGSSSAVDGGSGDDSLNVYDYSGGAGSIAVAGGDGNDTVSVGGSGAHASVDGGAGDDMISLNAYNGINTVIGGAGNDHIYNNYSNAHTTYSWQAGDASSAQYAVDTISGYNVNNDTIDLSGLLDGLAGNEASDDDRRALISFEAIQAESSRDMVISVHNAPQGEVVQQIVLENALAPDQNTATLIEQMNILLQSGGNY